MIARTGRSENRAGEAQGEIVRTNTITNAAVVLAPVRLERLVRAPRNRCVFLAREGARRDRAGQRAQAVENRLLGRREVYSAPRISILYDIYCMML